MTDYDRRPRWRDAVLTSSKLRPLTKLVLIVTLDHMRPNGKVCVERGVIKERLSLNHVQRVSDGWAQACQHGFLNLVHKGSHGRPSTYEALIPSALVTVDPVTISDRHTRSLGSPQIRSLGNPLSDRGSGHYNYSPGTDSGRASAGVLGPVLNASIEDKRDDDSALPESEAS